MVMSRGIVSYIICMLYVIFKITTVIKINKLIYFSYIGIIIRVYGIMFIANDIVNKITIRIFWI